jgi:hypothetical protein
VGRGRWTVCSVKNVNIYSLFVINSMKPLAVLQSIINKTDLTVCVANSLLCVFASEPLPGMAHDFIGGNGLHISLSDFVSPALGGFDP